MAPRRPLLSVPSSASSSASSARWSAASRPTTASRISPLTLATASLHALAAVAVAAVAELDRLVGAGAGAARDRGPAPGAGDQLDLDLDGRVAAGVEDLPPGDVVDDAHVNSWGQCCECNTRLALRSGSERTFGAVRVSSELRASRAPRALRPPIGVGRGEVDALARRRAVPSARSGPGTGRAQPLSADSPSTPAPRARGRERGQRVAERVLRRRRLRGTGIVVTGSSPIDDGLAEQLLRVEQRRAGRA